MYIYIFCYVYLGENVKRVGTRRGRLEGGLSDLYVQVWILIIFMRAGSLRKCYADDILVSIDMCLCVFLFVFMLSGTKLWLGNPGCRHANVVEGSAMMPHI